MARVNRDAEKKRLYQIEYGKRRRREDPEGRRAYGRAQYRKHAERAKASAKRQRQLHPGFHTWYRSIRRHNLTVDQFHARYERQDFCCAICQQELAGRIMIDHDHMTGRIRGLLCGMCNFGIGHLGESPERLRTAADYIESHRV